MDIVAPRFSWALEADRRNVRMSHYELEVTDAAGHPAWNTGRVKGDRSHLIAYSGKPLEACTRYLWRVRAWAGEEETPWSAPASFETGRMERPWQAQWITGGEAAPGMSRLPLLRRAFTLTGEVASARIYASALGLYRLRLNGQPVSADYFTPCWTS